MLLIYKSEWIEIFKNKIKEPLNSKLIEFGKRDIEALIEDNIEMKTLFINHSTIQNKKFGYAHISFNKSIPDIIGYMTDCNKIISLTSINECMFLSLFLTNIYS